MMSLLLYKGPPLSPWHGLEVTPLCHIPSAQIDCLTLNNGPSARLHILSCRILTLVFNSFTESFWVDAVRPQPAISNAFPGVGEHADKAAGCALAGESRKISPTSFL